MGRSIKKFTTKDGREVQFEERDPHTLTAEQAARLQRIYAYFERKDKEWAERIARGGHILKGQPRGLTK